MNIRRGAIIVFSLAFTMSSCSSVAPAATETPSPNQSNVPTSTSTAEPTVTSTETSRPKTETPSSVVLSMPSGTPLVSWEGFPIMPNAIAGEGDAEGYSFSISASSDEIQRFYEQELAILGWNMLGVGQGDTGAALLIFTEGASTASVGIFPQAEGVTLVLLVK
jgi:hypothetical protein